MKFAFSLLVSSALLAGCSSIHIYDKAADETATAAKADIVDSKMADSLKGQRAVLESLGVKEVEAFRRQTLAERDLMLLSLVTSVELPNHTATVENSFIFRFQDLVRVRLTEINANPDLNQAQQAKAFADDVDLSRWTAKEKTLRTSIMAGRKAMAKLPNCSPAVAGLSKDETGDLLASLLNADSKTRAAINWPDLQSQVNDYGAACASKLLAKRNVEINVKSYGGLLSGELAILGRMEAEATEREELVKAAAAELKKAAKAVADDEARIKLSASERDLRCPPAPLAPTAPPAPKAVTDSIESDAKPDAQTSQKKICATLSKLAKLNGAGDRVIAEQKLEQIGQVLSAISGVEPSNGDGDVKPSLAILAAATRLSSALDDYQTKGEYPALESLIIEKQLASAQLISATARLALDQWRLTQHRELVAGLKQEQVSLSEAYYTMKGYGVANSAPSATCGKGEEVHCASLEALLRSERVVDGVPLSRLAYRGMLLLAESYSVGRDRATTARVKLASSDYRESMIRSEEALAAWQSVISNPVDEIQRYNAGGLKPEALAGFLQALGLFGIATK